MKIWKCFEIYIQIEPLELSDCQFFDNSSVLFWISTRFRTLLPTQRDNRQNVLTRTCKHFAQLANGRGFKLNTLFNCIHKYLSIVVLLIQPHTVY